MATLQELKKKLRGIQSTEKLTKAMKTVSAAKHSSISRVYNEYSVYAKACMSLYEKYEAAVNGYFPKADRTAPAAVFLFLSNKGMCGGFNTETFNFALEELKKLPDNTIIFPCGKKAAQYLTERGIAFSKSFVFSDVPTEAEAKAFLSEILSLRKNGTISDIYMIYPRYKNILTQIPVSKKLFSTSGEETETAEETLFFVPDKGAVMENIAGKVIFAAVFSVILETALGAQAATLTTMRSAYDAASQYAAQLEIQINRKRQSEVTADVIEARGTHKE